MNIKKLIKIPFYDVFTTKELIEADLAVKIPGFILTAAAWGCILIFFVYWNAL